MKNVTHRLRVFVDHTNLYKGNKQGRNPLLSYAVDLLPVVIGSPIRNREYNKGIRQVVAIAGIEKEITSHLARHTFGTIAINKGIRIEVLQHLMGHKNIKTTQIYAKLMDATKVLELAKWHL